MYQGIVHPTLDIHFNGENKWLLYSNSKNILDACFNKVKINVQHAISRDVVSRLLIFYLARRINGYCTVSEKNNFHSICLNKVKVEHVHYFR